MADKDLSELINQLGVSARATETLASAQRTAAQAVDRLVASIGNLNRQVLKGANEFEAVSRSVVGYASALRAVASAQMEIAKAQTPASASLKATESAASAGAEKLKAARDTAKDLTGVMVDTAASLALGEAPLKVLIGRGADLSKVLLKAKIDGVDLGAAFGSVSGSAGMLEAAAMGVTGAQLAQAVASRVAGGAAGEAAAKNVIAAETAVAATLATSEAAVASRGLSAALLGAVGGPVGLVVGALVAGVTALAFAQRDAAQSSVAAAGASDVSAQAISDLNEILHQDPTPGVTANIREYTKAQLDRAKATYEVARADLMAKKAGAEARLSDLEDGVVTEKTGPRGTYRQRRLSTFGTRAGSELERERGAAREAAKSAADGLTTLDAGYDRTNKAILAHSKQLERAQNASLGNTQAIKAHTVAQSADDEAWSRGVEASEDFARALSEEIAVMGLSNEEIRRREINLQILNAPTSKLHDHLVDLRDQWELQTSVMREAKVQQEAVAKQQGETLHTMRDVIGDGPHFSTIFEDITDALTKNVAQADAARTSIEGIATALNKNDWTGALGGMVHLLEQLEKAFGKAGTTAEKFSAAAGVAQGIGGIIGGKTGSAISGIASGALSGASLGSVVPGIGTAVGAAVGAIIGGLGSLFGSSKAKKQAKAQAAAEEAQRQAQIAAQGVDLDIQIAEANGDTATAKRLRRQQTLGGIAPANQARQQQLFDIEDAKQREAEIKAVNDALTSLSMVFGSVGDATDAARDRLIKLSGGLEAFTSQTAFFAEHFLSEDERLKPVKDSVSSELKRLGLSPDLTRDGFKSLVLTQDVSTEGGAKLYAALMTLAPAFDKVATAAEAAKAAVEDKKTSILDQIDALVLSPAEQLAKSRKAEMEAVKALDETLAPFLETLWKAQDAAEAAKLATDRSNMYADLLEAQGRSEEAKALRRANALAAIDDPIQKQYQQQIWAAEDAAAKVAAARDVLTQAYQREHDALQATKDKFADLSKSLRAFSAGLSGTIAGADLAGRYRTTRQSFLTTASLARLGDPDAMGRLQAEGEAFTAASRDYVSTSQDYLRDVGLVRSAVDEAADTADRQVSIAQQQLEALDASVEGLIQINASVVSVRDAIAGLQTANQAAAAAGVGSVGGVSTGFAGGVGKYGGLLTDHSSDAASSDGQFVEGDLYDYDFHVEMRRRLDAQIEANRAMGYEKWKEKQEAIAAEGEAWLDSVWGGYPGAYREAMGRIDGKGGIYDYNTPSWTENDWRAASGQPLQYATGGSFEVGGAGPPDSKLFNLALSPGEAVNVRRRGDSGDEALVNELRRLREEFADLRATSARIATSNDKMERTLTNVTEGGRAMQTQAAA